MIIEVEPLPWAADALEPHISERTIRFHYEKHHLGYAEKLRALLGDDAWRARDLESLIRKAEGELYQNAAQVWNHTFYWQSMLPGGGGDPEGALLDVMVDAFDSMDAFREEFAEAANGEFGSGWAWLVRDKYGRLTIQNSSDAENPIQHEYVPLLVLDVWEHAYYLDYQNERARYVEAFLEHLVDWGRVAERLQVVEVEAETGDESESDD